MLRYLFVLSTALIASQAFAQNCDCLSQFSYTVSYYENNNPAFQKIKASRRDLQTYNAGVKKLVNEARKEKDRDRCILYLDQYVALLKDHHSGIGFNLTRIDLSTPELITRFKNSTAYKKFQKVSVDTARVISTLSSKPLSGIEGIYSDGRNTVFGIVQRENSPGKYIGVVLRQNKLLDVGHILLELTKGQNNQYDVIYNTGLLGFNFQKIFKSLVIENGQMPSIGFSKTFKTLVTEEEYEFKPLNDSTNYLRLHSFDQSITSQLDSFYTSISVSIKSKPFLIIDLRGNGGGSEGSYFNLLQYAYTTPLAIDPAEVWVSPGNIRRYEEMSSDNNKDLVARMKKARPFSFIPQADDAATTWALDSATIFPKKIALLFDRGTASAAEGMITYFMQSDKVITIGENSGGYIGFGNVMTHQTPCGQYTLQSTTTKYREKSKYEFVGIPPMYKVSKGQNWIGYALKLLSE